MTNAGLPELLLMAALAILLVVAAAIDIRTRTIPNGLTIAVALLAPLLWWATGLPLWPDAAIRLAVAAGVFALFAAFFYLGMMGGGDVKLAAAIALWFAPAATVLFMVVVSIAGGAVTLATMAWHRWRAHPGQPEVPYGVAIAIGGMWLLAQRFLNHFA